MQDSYPQHLHYDFIPLSHLATGSMASFDIVTSAEIEK